MRYATGLVCAIALAAIAMEARGDGAPGLWAPAEPVWPWQAAGRLWEIGAAEAGRSQGATAWPKTMAEICRDSLLTAFREICAGKSRPRPVSLTLDVGAYPTEKRYPLGVPFEAFSSDWRSVRVDPEIGDRWNDLPPAVKAELAYPVSPHSFIYLRVGLRRDLSAWHADPLGGNLPLTPRDVDLNEPSLGYFHAENDFFAFTLGRMPVQWSPSPDFGVTLSKSVPYHNGAEFDVKMPRVRYRFLVSSFNPWLEGTPAGEFSSEDYPVGSEQWRQRHYRDSHNAYNAHKRVYAEDVKTLFAHRLETWIGPLALGLSEVEIIGGKIPDLRDANPFAAFHNDFKDGYVNSGIGWDALLRLPLGATLAAEVFLDDVRYVDTEGRGDAPALMGYLAELRQAGRFREWTVSQSVDVIRTDPFLYGYLQPLNTLASRQILTTNYGVAGDVNRVDKLVIDHPVGYARGGDALDFWYWLEAVRGPLSLRLSLGVLAKGEVDIYTPYENYYTGSHDSPSGVAERELRARLDGAWRWRSRLTLRAAAAWQRLDGAAHVAGVVANHGQVSAGLAWDFPE